MEGRDGLKAKPGCREQICKKISKRRQLAAYCQRAPKMNHRDQTVFHPNLSTRTSCLGVKRPLWSQLIKVSNFPVREKSPSWISGLPSPLVPQSLNFQERTEASRKKGSLFNSGKRKRREEGGCEEEMKHSERNKRKTTVMPGQSLEFF